MQHIRIVRSVGLAAAMAAGLIGWASGCGTGGASEKVEVSPEFQKKTEDMLKNMKNVYKAKHEQENAAKRKMKKR